MRIPFGFPRKVRWYNLIRHPRTGSGHTRKAMAMKDAVQRCNVNLAQFFKGFEVGEKVDIDGPLSANGDGQIKRIDADALNMSADVRHVGKADVKLTCEAGDVFNVSVGDTTMKAKATRKGNSLDFQVVGNPSQHVKFTVEGNEQMRVSTTGMETNGTFAITVKH